MVSIIAKTGTYVALVGVLLGSTSMSAAAGGIPTCQSALNTCNTTLLRTRASLATCTTNLGTCDSSLSTCTTNLGTCDSSRSTCTTNLGTCDSSLSTCTTNLATCHSSLSTCTTNLAVAQACGNGAIDAGEDCDQSNLNGQTCATQGFVAGTLKCGSGCVFDTSACSNTRFVDNGDGTVSDLNTGLQWEKKDNLDSVVNYADPHDADNSYTWSVSGIAPDGNAYTDFLAKLNNGASTDGGAMTAITGCFAGHCDWRLPSIVELRGIVDATQGFCGGGSGACIDPAFGATKAFYYWSTTNSASTPFFAWDVHFDGGGVNTDGKGSLDVRAVRGGL